jgi:hypothetical protein
MRERDGAQNAYICLQIMNKSLKYMQVCIFKYFAEYSPLVDAYEGKVSLLSQCECVWGELSYILYSFLYVK